MNINLLIAGRCSGGEGQDGPQGPHGLHHLAVKGPGGHVGPFLLLLSVGGECAESSGEPSHGVRVTDGCWSLMTGAGCESGQITN